MHSVLSEIIRQNVNAYRVTEAIHTINVANMSASQTPSVQPQKPVEMRNVLIHVSVLSMHTVRQGITEEYVPVTQVTLEILMDTNAQKVRATK